MLTVIHTMYSTGCVRDAAGKLIAFYDATKGELHLDGEIYPRACHSDEEAMYIVGEIHDRDVEEARQKAILVNLEDKQ